MGYGFTRRSRLLYGMSYLRRHTALCACWQPASLSWLPLELITLNPGQAAQKKLSRKRAKTLTIHTNLAHWLVNSHTNKH